MTDVFRAFKTPMSGSGVIFSVETSKTVRHLHLKKKIKNRKPQLTCGIKTCYGRQSGAFPSDI